MIITFILRVVDSTCRVAKDTCRLVNPDRLVGTAFRPFGRKVRKLDMAEDLSIKLGFTRCSRLLPWLQYNLEITVNVIGEFADSAHSAVIRFHFQNTDKSTVLVGLPT